MKFLVGLLVTIENEYEDCIKSIKSQKGVEYDIFEVRDKPKNEAHDKLYTYFMENTNKYDLMIHIGPDMVISDNYLFGKIVKEFEENELLDRLFIPTYDHFVGINLGGVNIYRNSVKWNKNKDNFYTDRVHNKESIRESKKWNPSETEPLIHHCPNPGDFQAFHFGLHRAIKAFQFGKQNKVFQKIHWVSFLNIKQQYSKKKDRRLLLPLVAANIVVSKKLDDSFIDYTNNFIISVFNDINKKSNHDLEKEAFYKWPILALTILRGLSYYLICYIYDSIPTRRGSPKKP